MKRKPAIICESKGLPANAAVHGFARLLIALAESPAPIQANDDKPRRVISQVLQGPQRHID